MKLIELNGYSAKIDYSLELKMFWGEFLGLAGSADFYGRNPQELRAEFKKSLEVFLQVCQEKGICPNGRSS
jgi:predicted HicB family RNase H-like nuclease